MALEKVELGAIPSGIGGDTPRAAWEKWNRNADVIDSALGSITTIVADVEELKQEIEAEVAAALAEVDAKVAAAEAQINAAIATIPGQVDTAIAGRIPGKNRLINGDMSIWQRGVSFGAAVYTADRWYFNAGGVTSPNLTRNPIAIGTAGVRAAAYAKINYGAITGGASHFVVFEQRIEGVANFAGDTVTVSFKVFNSGAAGRQIAVEMQQVFGTGGAATVVGIGAKKYSLAVGLNTISHTVAVPSVAGKASGANNALVLTLWATGGANFNTRNESLGDQAGDVHFTEVQMETGTSATGFEYRPIGVELILCQRYYEKSYPLDIAPGSVGAVSGQQTYFLYGVVSRQYSFGGTVSFKVEKRIAPAVTCYSVQSGAPGKAWSAAPVGDVNASVENSGSSSVFLAIGPVTSDNLNCRWQWTADAEL